MIHGLFAPWTFRPPDVSPPGRFAPRMFRPPDVSPPLILKSRIQHFFMKIFFEKIYNKILQNDIFREKYIIANSQMPYIVSLDILYIHLLYSPVTLYNIKSGF